MSLVTKWGWAAMLGAVVAGCASDFVTDPTRPRPTRAVESPNYTGSGSGEVMAEPMGTVPLVTVDLPNTKNDPFVVHTIVEPAGPMAATQPAGGAGGAATKPANGAEGVPATAAGGAVKDELKVVAQQRPADQFRIVRDNEANADVWVLCPSGIGTVTLERTGDSWPAVIRVHLRYDTEKEFTRLEGFTASELTAAGGKVALKTVVENENGKAEITIPGFARGTRIQIEWVDMYR